MGWALHVLNARGALSWAETELRASLGVAQAELEARTTPLSLDVIVAASADPLPPPLVVGGACFVPGQIELTLDASKAVTSERLREEILKTVYHEFHHALRWDGPGYGNTLGEALVTEGLAQIFVHEVMKCPPEPWEVMPSGVQLSLLCQSAYASFDDEDYSHEDWFFGVGAMPRWAGYALGKALVARHLEMEPGRTALSMACEPAAQFQKTLAVLAREGSVT